MGSASEASSLGSESSIGFVRLMSQHTLPRHSTSIFWPGSILLISTSIGAPAACARAEGQNDMMNGTSPRRRLRRRRCSCQSAGAAGDLSDVSRCSPSSMSQEARKPKAPSREERLSVIARRVSQNPGLYGIWPGRRKPRLGKRPECAVESGSCRRAKLAGMLRPILALFRAGLHALRRRAVRRLDTASRPAAAPHRARGQCHRHAGDD